jgi:type IV pilus assembly protein PilX
MLIRSNLRASQAGAVLIVGLIMVLLMTIIGLAAIRGSDMQERMAGNMRDRNLAFQSAEAAVRAGEELLDSAVIPSFTGNTVGYWPDLNKPGAIRERPVTWDIDQWAANSVVAAGMNLVGVNEQPRYTIERVVVAASAQNEGSGVDVVSQQTQEDGEFFRITGRGVGGTATSDVVIQTTFKR